MELARRFVTRSVFWLFGLVAAHSSLAQTAAVATAADTPAATESQQQGRKLLMDMANFLASAERFSVSVRGGYEVLQVNGYMIQFLEARDITLVRPDQLRIREQRSGGRDNYTLFDGTTMTVWDAEQGVYAQAPQPGSIDDTVVYMIRDLQLQLPLASILTTRLPMELERRVEFVDYVEPTEIADVAAHHIVGSTDSVHFQAWIADGDEPYLLRMVLVYRNEPGQPQFWADLTDWQPHPRTTKDTFRFDAPADAQQIPLAVQIPIMADGIDGTRNDGDEQ